MTIELYDSHPERLKKKIAQCYRITAQKGSRLMIPGKNDCIFIQIWYRRDMATPLTEIFNRIAKAYWTDRVTFKYKGLKEDLIKDLWRPPDG